MLFLRLLLPLLALSVTALSQPLQLSSSKVNDPGLQVIAKMDGSLIYASNGDALEGTKALSGKKRELITAQSKIRYKEYYHIGSDQASVFRAYETWLQPIEASEALMLSCEPRSIKDDGIKFDINFWQNNKKIFSTECDAKYGAPLIITGPSWRQGKLLYVLELKK